MANLFVNIPVPAANGVGAAVDVSAMGKTKSFICGGSFNATVNVEYSTDAGGVDWAPLATFHQSGNLTIDVAAHWMRAVTSDYKSGAPNLDVGSSDAGTLFALLPSTGAAVDISALPEFKTVIAPSKVIIEVSEDGASWAQIFSLPNGGDESQEVIAQFARVVGGVDVTMAATSDGGGGTGGGGGILSLYGDGSFGDHVTAGNETWTTVAGAPGAPAVPGGSSLPFAFFNNLTISPGDVVVVGTDTENAVVIFVKGTLTIGAGSRIEANGFDAPPGGLNPFGNPGGNGRKAIIGSVDGGAGGLGGGTLVGVAGAPGVGGASRPAQATATMIGGAGGNTSFQLVNVSGGPGGTCQPDPSWPYSLSQAIAIASLLYAIGGGNGGGGGAGAGSGGFGGGGGGGAGTLVIFAKTIVFADPGCVQAVGGDGGSGASSENIPGAGGGGGTGGTIVIVTENATLAGISNVSGGAAGAGAGFGFTAAQPGGPGEAIAFNPMLAAQIPV